MMNKVMLIGRLARDPELKEFASGGALANLRVMTNHAWRDKASGEMREKAQGHTVVIHSESVARRLAKVLQKGHMVYVEGMLEHRQWQSPEGQTRYATEVVVRPYLGTIRKLPLTAGSTPSGEPVTAPTEVLAPTTPPQDGQDTPITPAFDSVEIDFFSEDNTGLDDGMNFLG